MTNDTKKSSYYDADFDIGAVLADSNLYDELFHVRDLQQRKLYLEGEIDAFNVADLTKHILQYNAEDKSIEPKDRAPILLYITSNGGDFESGLKLINTIQCSKTPVYTINLGQQYSMAFLIGLAGHKRFAMPDARYLMHDGVSVIAGSSTKVKDRFDFDQKLDEKVEEFVLSRSNISAEEYESRQRIEWYMFADEAKEKGFTDYIIGTDCDIDTII